MTLVSGWGRFPVVDSNVLRPRSFAAVGEAVSAGTVARGNGRAYGDAAIGAARTVAMTGFDRVRWFDPASGRIRLEAGMLLSDLIETFGPRGFLPFVVPGTRFVSIGGAIAADVHGKNHHGEGGFGRYLDSILLRTGQGEVIETSREQNSDAFFATVGGMGLTGIILEATMRLRPVETGWIRERVISASDLDAAMRALDAGDAATYSVAWLDCAARGRDLGRALIYLGEHAGRDELAAGAAAFPVGKDPGLGVPVDLPSITLNRLSIRAFNELYYRVGARRAGGSQVVSLYPYFFPLDGLKDWNRIYGKRGFLQHQCVIPEQGAREVLGDILQRVAHRGDASFLAVLKKLGQGDGILSFPLPGYTLALDFPLKGDILNFLDEIDRLVVAAGGRLYLAKDARQSRATFAAGYPALQRFNAIRRSLDPTGNIRSKLSQRLFDEV
ncbi:FAD-binding oxidoreductase [Bradyrhizobium sp. 180]|uniref:FAD-binding oxidoreductase n=1 Tax=unclassified Bradyrhizobium TaxID=2631580 RepID=UPI001FFA8067|nr:MULTISPECIES: FAD-binding oxidoreductase [unclassified Bradyrhizobium]MCK1420109.1 FAD-binding oxidoreductase [Bradyrhizobium sp. CW12]MCK1490736.1 FAD-binding oxidoreductase [Bradyrhizobium sp. 180]MCK1531747.1 FAD-binding oxidoreductase [Bradyrhizobium sp. 182]MCK1594314.1 FAD-binding oxidoreductase [Bradyrhizobium sp. 164]MCK1621038.1 FAD-binding oxidoreductase [Bradyrhizobium sp. 159]